MIEYTYQVLGYYRLLEILSRYASCSLGRSNCLSLQPSNDPILINDELMLVSEMRLLLKTQGLSPVVDLSDLVPLLEKSNAEGTCLDTEEFLAVLSLAEEARRGKRLFLSEKLLCPGMYRLFKDIPDLETLVKRLRDAIALNGDIKDRASPALAKIRKNKIRQRSHLETKLGEIRKSNGLVHDRQESLVTVRDGRYVIAMRSDQRSRIDGIVHDYSHTKATCFVEPIEVIQDNNRSAQLALEERTEENRILIGLTNMVRDKGADLVRTQALVAKLDGLYARARFGEDQSCVVPEIGEGFQLRLDMARNPILLASAQKTGDEMGGNPVPVDILLDDDRNILIISGPNRGGKTVTVKTLGLLSLMAQAGIPIPAAEGSCLPVFDQVMADIGDDQDIQTGLSTFSAHAAHLKYIIENAGKKSLIVIDEPGMGTDPNEGAALTMAVLDDLSEKGAFVALSTHLNRLKAYGLSNRHAINASVQFDTERNRPTFRLKYGSPGISHALETARDLGLSPGVLANAREYLDHEEVRLNLLIDKMNRLIVEAEDEKREAEKARKEYHVALKETEERKTELEAETGDFLEVKRIEAEEVIRKAKEELRQAINLLKSRKEKHQADVVEKCEQVGLKLLQNFESESKDSCPAGPNDLMEGQAVYHKKLKREGVVLSVDPSGRRARLMLGSLKIFANRDELQKVDRKKGPDSDKSFDSVTWNFKNFFSGDLNVVGYRVDDAIPIIDRTIDRALVDGTLSVKIIHGFGTGRLRQAIREHLKGVPFVRNINSAEPRSGGEAVTVVELG